MDNRIQAIDSAVRNHEGSWAAAAVAFDSGVSAERERWLKAAAAALEVIDDLPAWSNGAHACQLLREALGPNV